MSQSWVADRYHVYLWILDVVIFRPDKFCSQVVVRGNVSVHRWSTYLLKQSMIESGYIYIYIVDGASFVLFKYFFRGRQIAFFGGGPRPSAARAELRCVAGFGCTRSATAQFAQGWNLSGGVLGGLQPPYHRPPSSAGTPSGMGRALFRQRESGFGGWSCLLVDAVPHLGKSHSSQKSKMPMWMFFLTVCSQENW